MRGQRRSAAVVSALAVLFLVSLYSTTASAATKYVPVGQFPPSYPQNLSWTPSYFQQMRAHGVAVSAKNGHIYVADSGQGAVFDFESTSDKTADRWNGENTPAGSFGGGRVSVAVDNTSGDVYVADRSHAVVVKFDEDGNLVETFGDTAPTPNGQLSGAATPAGSFIPPTSYFSSWGIAVNQATHELYVVDGGHEVIDVFAENGAYLRQITDKPPGMFRSGGEDVTGIAVSTAGNLFVSEFTRVEFGNNGPIRIFKFDSLGDFVSTWDGGSLPNGADSSIPQGEFGSFAGALAVSDATGEVLVGDSSRVSIFDEAGNFLPPQLEGISAYAVAVDQSNRYLYVGTDFGSVQVFRPVVVADVVIDPASSVGSTSAQLSGHVDPAGAGDITACRFEYIAYGKFLSNPGSNRWQEAVQVPCETDPPLSPPFSGPTDVSASIDGLEPGRRYHLRLIASTAQNSNIDYAPDLLTEGEYRFSGVLGSSGSGDGQLSGPKDVAVDNATGEVYVADTGNHRVVKFDSAGAFVAAWGWGVDDGSASSQVCSSGCQAGVAGSGAGQLQAPRYIEVDNSDGASAHMVYVADAADATVQKFSPAGGLVSSWGDEGSMDFSGDGSIAGITVDDSGDLLVSTTDAPQTWTQIGQDGVFKTKINTANGPYNVELGPPGGGGIEVDVLGGLYQTMIAGEGGVIQRLAGTPSYTSRRLYSSTFNASLSNTGLAVDRAMYDTYVAQTDHIDQIKPPPNCFSTNGAGLVQENRCEPDDSFGYDQLTEAWGLAFASVTRTLYAADAARDRIAVFDPVPMPTVTTGDATSAGGDIELTGHVAPFPGDIVASCRFEYGTDLTYGEGSVPCSPAGSLSAGTDVTAMVSGLPPLTTYHYRIVAEGSNAWENKGADRTVTVTGSLPLAEGGLATEVVPGGATLSAQINPQLAPTTYRFQYGTSTDYGRATAAAPIGADDVAHPVSTAITGLEPGTTYHFRVVATNFNGQAFGPDRNFTTPAPPSVSDSAISQITTTTATVRARIEDGSRPTTVVLEYGPTTAYGHSLSAAFEPDGVAHEARLQISGLNPGSAYHARMVATNDVGSVSGGDLAFSTTPAGTGGPTSAAPCKRGFVRKRGKCRKRHKKRAHHKKGARK